jgi:hypothetical protein
MAIGAPSPARAAALVACGSRRTARATIAWAEKALAALPDLRAEDGDGPPPSTQQPDEEHP